MKIKLETKVVTVSTVLTELKLKIKRKELSPKYTSKKQQNPLQMGKKSQENIT